MTDLQRLEALFHEALAQPAAERAAYLDQACDDGAQRQRLVSMLTDHESGASLAPPSPAQVVTGEGAGSVIGRYKLLQQIGEGGFGEVYMAEQQEPVVRRVALKLIKLGMDTKEVVARFEAERQALAMMDHPGIARVLDGGATESGRPYFVMELVRGISITEFCDENQLDTRARLELFVDVCLGVQHAHQKGVIHRDLKPRNVLVTLHDGRPVPKIIDFGIAKAMHTRLTEKTLFTEFQRFIGTPAYMSPEQAEMSALDIDTRADIYSLGVLLYELLTGTTPLDSGLLLERGMSEVQRAIREDPAPRPSARVSTSGDAQIASARKRDTRALARSLRGDLDWIVMRAIEKERERRYGTASDLASDVRRHLAGEPVLAGPPSAMYRFRKFFARHRAGVLVSALATLALVLGIAGLVFGMLTADRQRDKAEGEAIAATAALDYVLATLSLTDPAIARDPNITVRALLDHAAARVDEAFAGRPFAEARVRATIGEAYASLEEPALAERHLKRAVELMAGLEDYDQLEHYTSLWTLTNVSFKLSRPNAYIVANRAREVGLAHLGARYPKLAGLLHDLTLTVYGASLDPAPEPMRAALELFDNCRAADDKLRRGDPLWPIVADTYVACGYQIWYTPHEAASAELWHEALTIQLVELPPGHPSVGETLIQLVGVLNRAGKPREAQEHIERSLEILRDTYPNDDNFRIGQARSLLGQSLVLQERYIEAERHLIEGYEAIKRSRSDPGDFWALDALTRLIELYDAIGDEESARPRRKAMAETLAGAAIPGMWRLSRQALGPDYAAAVACMDALDARCTPTFTAVTGTVSAPELGPVLAELGGELLPALPADSNEACVLARHIVYVTNMLAPGQLVDERRASLDAAIEVLRHWNDAQPIELGCALAHRSHLAHERGDDVRAVQDAREAWRLVKDEPPSFWHAENPRVHVARVLIIQGLLEEAEGILVASYENLHAQLGKAHQDPSAARDLLVELYTRWGKTTEAEAYRRDTAASGG